MKNFLVKVSTVAIMGAVLVGGNAAFAADSVSTTTSPTIQGGSLSVTTPTIGAFGTITLDGTIQNPQVDLGTFTVTDPTGSGAGWNVVMKAGQFTDSLNNRVLPLNSLSIGTPTLTAGAGSDPVDTITVFNSAMGNTIDNANGLKILSAATEGGMGTYDVAANKLTLKLEPKDVKAGNYSSTVTVTITTGP